MEGLGVEMQNAEAEGDGEDGGEMEAEAGIGKVGDVWTSWKDVQLRCIYVKGGPNIPSGKSRSAYISPNTYLVSRLPISLCI